MELNVKKVAQGPVLAKGEPNTSYCGRVDIPNGGALGCASTDSNGMTTAVGVNGQNGGTVGVQYSGPCSC